MIIPRQLVREYLAALVTASAGDDVGGRVYVGRPNQVMRDHLPFILIMPLNEVVSELGGSRFVPHDYERIMTAEILVVAEQPNDPGESETAEDRLDTIGRKIEKGMRDDQRFQKLLSSWEGNFGDEGILSGSRLASVSTDLESESETSVAAMQLTYELLYEDESFNTKRETDFESFLIELRRVGWDSETVDPVLIAAEGEVND
jgi:hypothetical protein